MSLPLVLVLLWRAAVLGNQSNYTIGRAIGPRVFGWKQSRWFNKQAFDQAHAFYETLRRRSRSSLRASCRSCARSRPSSPASRR